MRGLQEWEGANVLPLFTTSPLDIVDAPADEKHTGRARRMPPCFIYLHATGGKNSLSWLTTESVPPVSCHRLIAKDGTIYKIVPDELEAWTQGFGVLGARGPGLPMNCNRDGLSIEFENMDDGKDPYPAIQLLSGARQVFEWHGLYGFLPILGHADVDTRKKDPAGFPWNIWYGLLVTLYRGIHWTTLRDRQDP